MDTRAMDGRVSAVIRHGKGSDAAKAHSSIFRPSPLAYRETTWSPRLRVQLRRPRHNIICGNQYTSDLTKVSSEYLLRPTEQEVRESVPIDGKIQHGVGSTRSLGNHRCFTTLG